VIFPMPQEPMVHYETWKKVLPAELWEKYGETYGAVFFGSGWNGKDVYGLSTPEVIAAAADFLTALGDWANQAAGPSQQGGEDR